MSQRDLVAELRGARISAPADVRARVRLIAAADTTRTRRTFTWRRALVLAVPVAAAIGAAIVLTRPSHSPPVAVPVERSILHGAPPYSVATTQGKASSAPAVAHTARTLGLGDAGPALRGVPRAPRAQIRTVSRPVSSARFASPGRSAATPARCTRPRPAQRAAPT